MTPHDLLANFETLAEAPNGIQRLRELVLELAVRGKLVEQDPEDEPARRLLERAKACKAKLSNSGRQGRSSIAAVVDLPFDLPQGWSWARMEDCCDIKSGVTKGRNLQGMECQDFPYLRVANVQAGYTALDVIKTIPLPLVELDAYRLIKGDVLLTEGGDWDKLGRSAVWAGEIDPCIHQNHVFRARCLDQGIRSRWISSFTNSPDGRTYFQSCSKQTTNLASINMTQLKGCPVPIPPSAEQDRILDRLDELMALLDRLEVKRQEREAARSAARDSALAALREAPTPDDVETAWLRIQERFHELFATPEDVEPLRLAILQLAVAGRLVPQNANDTSAVVALRKIEECRRQWIKTGRMRVGKPNPAISEAEIPFQIPEGWALARLGDVLADIQPGWSPQCEGRPRVGAEWGVLKVSACSWGRFLPEENKALPAGMEVPPDIEVQPGDWIISRANTTELVGRSVLAVECPPHLLLSDKTLRLVPMPGFSPRWGNLVNHAPSSRAHYAAKAGGTSASMRNISQEVIRNLVIAIPPIEEQDRIYAKFETLMAILDRLVGTLDSERNLSSTFAAAAVHHLEA